MRTSDRLYLLLDELLTVSESTVSSYSQTDEWSWRLSCEASIALHLACHPEREILTLSATIGRVQPDNRPATYEALLMLNSAGGPGSIRYGLNAPSGDIQLELDLPESQTDTESLTAAIDFLIERAALWLGIVARGGLGEAVTESEPILTSGDSFLRV